MGGDGKFEDKHTIFKKHQHSKTSPSDSVLVLIRFFFFLPPPASSSQSVRKALFLVN